MIARCKGTGCPLKDRCERDIDKSKDEYEPYFASPPFKAGTCEMFYGENSKHINNMLKDIVNGKVDQKG